MMGFIRVAWRNYSRNLRRYRVLLAALVMISLVLTVVLATVLGLQASVREKASRYFGGSLVVLGHSGDGTSVIEDPDAVEGAVRELASLGFTVEAVSRRSTFYAQSDIELFFAGYSIRQRKLLGVEWDRERLAFSRLDFADGGVPGVPGRPEVPGVRELPEGPLELGATAIPPDRAVLISTATAEALGIAVGDELVASIRSDRGRKNTADFIVAGIFSESSFFGYTAYLERRALNRLREAPEDNVNEIGVYLAGHGDSREGAAAAALTGELEARGFPTFPVITVRDVYSGIGGQKRDGRTYGVVTLSAQLAEITDLLTAITIIAGAVAALFLGIVTVGVGNTWTMVVWERTREIGTLRALGMQRLRTVTLFLLESVFLGLSGVVVGVGLGLAVLYVVRRAVVFAPNAFTTLFLTQGRLVWTFPLWGFLLITASALLAGFVGAGGAAIRAGRVNPVEALRQEK